MHEQAAVSQQIEKLRSLSTRALSLRYQELFGEAPRSQHRVFLFRQIAWRLQANVFGDLSDRARQRAAELANVSDLRLLPPRELLPSFGLPLKGGPAAGLQVEPSRALVPGSVLTRHYRSKRVEVRVLPKGFQFEGRWFQSLSGIAEHVTGTRWNGYVFFGLKKRK